MASGSIYFLVNNIIFFSWLNTTPIYIHHIFYVLPSVDLGSFHHFAIGSIGSPWTQMCRNPHHKPPFIPLGVCIPKRSHLDPRVVLLVNSWGISILTSVIVPPICTSANHGWRSIAPSPVGCCFLNGSHYYQGKIKIPMEFLRNWVHDVSSNSDWTIDSKFMSHCDLVLLSPNTERRKFTRRD